MSLRDLELPDRVHSIVLIGAGGIARDAHLPAYKRAGFTVASIFDIDRERARSLAEAFGIASLSSTLEEAVCRAAKDAVFDIATPPRAFLSILQYLPDGAVRNTLTVKDKRDDPERPNAEC
jgi:shikimate 5-dehydrogenase